MSERVTRTGPFELTAEDLGRLRDLENRPDDQIDLSDIPETTEEQWRWARRPGQPHRGGTARLDKDVLDWCAARRGDSDLDVIANLGLRLLMSHEGPKDRPPAMLLNFETSPERQDYLAGASDAARKAWRWSRESGLSSQRDTVKLDKDVLDWCLARMGGRDLDVVVNEALRVLIRRERELAGRAAA